MGVVPERYRDAIRAEVDALVGGDRSVELEIASYDTVTISDVRVM
jgi:hypothetical protein